MESRSDWKITGKLLEGMIRNKGYTINSFATKTMYSKSSLYRICNGDQDIMAMELFNFIIFGKFLGYDDFVKFAKDLKLDMLEDIVI